MTYYCSNCEWVENDQLIVMVLAPFRVRCNKCRSSRDLRSCLTVILDFQGTTLQKNVFLSYQNCDSCNDKFKCYTR